MDQNQLQFQPWSSLSGADIEEIHESRDRPFLVKQPRGVTPQKHTVKNYSVLYKPISDYCKDVDRLWLYSKINVPSFQLLLAAPE